MVFVCVYDLNYRSERHLSRRYFSSEVEIMISMSGVAFRELTVGFADPIAIASGWIET